MENALEILSKTGNSEIKNPTYDENNERNNDLTLKYCCNDVLEEAVQDWSIVLSMDIRKLYLASIFFASFVPLWQKLVDGGWDEVVDGFMTALVLFDATSDLQYRQKEDVDKKYWSS